MRSGINVRGLVRSAEFLVQCALLQVCFILPLQAADYFVGKNGSDGDIGSQAEPWLTVQKAADNMIAGDHVTIGPGTYSERVTTGAAGSSGSPITFQGVSRTIVSGGFTITHDWTVVDLIEMDGAGTPIFQGCIDFPSTTGGSNSVVSNCSFNDPPIDVYGIHWRTSASQVDPVNNGPHDVLIEGNSFSDLRGHGITLGGLRHTIRNNTFSTIHGSDAIRCFGNDHVISKNTFDRWGNPGITSGGIEVGQDYQFSDIGDGSADFSNVGAGSAPYTANATWTATGTTPKNWDGAKVLVSNHADIIQTFSVSGQQSSNVLFERNLIKDCETCQIGNFEDQALLGLVSDYTFRNNIYVNVFSSANIYCVGFKFYNNTFVRCQQNSGHVLSFNNSVTKGRADNGEVHNNIFYECGNDPAKTTRGWYAVVSGVVGFSADNNLVVGTGAGTIKVGFTEPNGLNGLDPEFVDSENGNVRLMPGTGCVGEARVFGELFTTDWDGVGRGSIWDIGAFEAIESDPPEPPSGLRVEGL